MPGIPLPALDALVASLGDAAILRPDDGLTAYEQPARGPEGGHAAAVVRPSCTDEVRTVVAWAREHRIRLLPQGANTGLVGASTPPAGTPAMSPSWCLSTERMLDGLQVDATDRSAVVPAGLRLSGLNEAVAGDGLWFPIDLAADPSLGGMAATNTGGARMVRYGDVRRRVLGLEVVVADDEVTVIDDLSILRKDNTGLNLGGLFVGSSGTLGVITRVAVELDRRPPARADMVWVPDGDAAAVRLLTALEELVGDRLSAYEVMSAESVEAALEAFDSLSNPFPARLPALMALVELSGPEGVDDELVEVADRLSRSGDLLDGVVMGAGRAWELRHRITEGLARRGVVVGFDISVPRSALAAFRDDARRAVSARFPRAVVADFGHWGDGGMHCNVVFPRDDGPTDAERAALAGVVFGLAVDTHGGSFSAEHGIGPHNAHWWRQVTPAGNRTASRALKNLFDPLGILGHPGLPY